MRINTQFDPVFDREDRRSGNHPRAEHKAFVFDGWSYQPITKPQQAEAVLPADPVP